MRILVIDDEDTIRNLVIAIVRMAGHEAVGAKDGSEGLKLNRALHADLVITDLCMPGIDGMKVVSEVASLS